MRFCHQIIFACFNLFACVLVCLCLMFDCCLLACSFACCLYFFFYVFVLVFFRCVFYLFVLFLHAHLLYFWLFDVCRCYAIVVVSVVSFVIQQQLARVPTLIVGALRSLQVCMSCARARACVCACSCVLVHVYERVHAS